MRRVLVTVLARLGGRVVEATNGKHAIARLNEPAKIDIALLDVLMPEAHGLFVLHAIRAGMTNQDFSMPVMLLTATRDEAVVHYAAGLSCDGFLLKPINQADLADRLAKIIARRMALPYQPPHYRKIDVGPPDQPPALPAVTKKELKISDLQVGMVFTAPVMSKGRIIVPKGTPVTAELLTLLRDVEKIATIEPILAQVVENAP
jgi:CheY-like chemotaxis protein